jgi:hypothetical protein
MDIAYCTNKDCPLKDCRRHFDNCPRWVPVTMADMGDVDGEPCCYYWPTQERKEETQA